MKKFAPSLLLLVTAAFVLAPLAHAKAKYISSLSIILSEICNDSECEGDIVNGQLILIGKDGRKHVAPDGAYTDESGNTIRVIDGKVLHKTDKPIHRKR